MDALLRKTAENACLTLAPGEEAAFGARLAEDLALLACLNAAAGETGAEHFAPGPCPLRLDEAAADPGPFLTGNSQNRAEGFFRLPEV